LTSGGGGLHKIRERGWGGELTQWYNETHLKKKLQKKKTEEAMGNLGVQPARISQKNAGRRTGLRGKKGRNYSSSGGKTVLYVHKG